MFFRTIGRRSEARWAATALVLASASAFARAAEPPRFMSMAEARLRTDVGYLADDLREGRAPGSNGIEASADYIAGVFREVGLKTAPGATGYFQPFTIAGGASLAGDPKLAFKVKSKSIEAKSKTEFAPLSIGTSASLRGIPIVFAGYGISAKDQGRSLDYDDYAGVDVKGKVVLILRREPRQDDEKSPFDGKQISPYADLRVKATTAFQHGAAGVILVNDYVSAKERDVLLPFNFAGGELNSTIPFLMATRQVADGLLEAAGMPKLAGLEKEIDSDLKPRSRLIADATADVSYTIERKEVKTKNVIGVLEGVGPLAEETIVVGAHYDHLGRGGMMSGSLAFMSNDIHNGADDNASGTSMVLELARRLARRSDPLPRRVVFMTFSGEEKGLLGSAYYVNHPLFPLDKTVFMVNFDMVGRLNEKDELSIFGVGSTPGAGELVDALGASAGFKIKKIRGMSDGIGGSDHESFYRKNIPTLFAFTGVHKDYHRPSDDSHLINYAGMSRIADFGELLLLDLARRPTRPELTKVGSQVAGHGQAAPAEPKKQATPEHAQPAPKAEDTARVSISAYLGSIPDYDDEAKGVKLAGTSDGSPAEKAGLKGGDVIIGFAGKPIATIYDYTNSLAKTKPGDLVEIKVKRDGKELTLKAKLGSRPRGN